MLGSEEKPVINVPQTLNSINILDKNDINITIRSMTT